MFSPRSALIALILTFSLFDFCENRLPSNIQNLELDDLTSLWEKFPAFLNKIKDAISRFRCPKGWRRLGGSCYLLPGVPSTAIDANQTCNLVHSNRSNLMKIRNTFELFYAAHILTKYNLSALMIEIDSNLLKGRYLTDLILSDQNRWIKIKEKILEMRKKYLSVKEKLFRELESAGIKISRRTQKFNKIVDDHHENLVPVDYHYDNDLTNSTESENFEYEDLNKYDDEDDDYDKFDSISSMCDQIDWNVLHNHSSVYILTTYIMSERIVCSLSDVEAQIEYDHICQYVLDFCFGNVVCGENGRCVNTLAGFKCSCGLLYGGLICDHISKQGYQIIFGIILVIFLYSLSLKPIRYILIKFFNVLTWFFAGICCPKKKKENLKPKFREDFQILFDRFKSEQVTDQTFEGRRLTFAEEIQEFFLPREPLPLEKPEKRDLVRLSWVGILTVGFLSSLFVVTTVNHFSSFKYEINDELRIESLINETVRLVSRCEKISDYRIGNVIFAPIALTLILTFSWSVKREKKFLETCDGRPGIIPPIEPFQTANRFTAATVFGILAFEVLQIFEEMIFSRTNSLSAGVFFELIERIAIIILVGLRYYPVLASLQLRNVTSRCFAFLYIMADIIYAMIREGSCMGFLPLSGFFSIAEEAKLRMELGTWFIIYGLIKNTPHFIFLSYIAAELAVRFAYDSIYVPLKKNRSIWESPICQADESRFAKYYVNKLFRRNISWNRKRKIFSRNTENLIDHENEAELTRKAPVSRVQNFFDWIYEWDDDFRFTNMATCTYAVAFIFLYYLACTFAFVYIFRTSGHIAFVRDYIESTFEIEIKSFFSLRSQIIASAIISMAIYSWQLFVGIKNYKKHKKQLFKGIYEDVPSVANFNLNSIASKSVHYSGFLVGYMAWGFVLCFHIILFILSTIRVLTLQTQYVELVLSITVPVILIYLLNMLGNSTAGRFVFIRTTGEKLNLKNRKTYAIFVYFNFFADCFLGMASCIIRFIKAIFLNVFYMARLDCSFLGRPLERLDLGFAAYVSYLHMEVTHTNPIMLAFCYTLYDDVIKKRPKQCYDDECCIAPGELNDSAHDLNDKDQTKPIESTSVTNQSERKRSTTKTKTSNTSKNEKKKGKSSNRIEMENETTEEIGVDEEEDGGLPIPTISTIGRLIPEKLPTLPPESALAPLLPKRNDIPSEDEDDEDDDGGIKPTTTTTINKIMPTGRPKLPNIESSDFPPPVPRRQDIEYDDEDDDGGVKVKPIVKIPKLEPQKKPRKPIDDDDDGVPIETITKQSKPNKTKKPKPVRRLSVDEDEDGGIHQEPKVKPTKQPKPARIRIDDDDDEDGGSKIKPKPSKPKKVENVKKTFRVSDDEDDDGGVQKRSHDTIIGIMPKKAPPPDSTRKPKESSPEIHEDGSMARMKIKSGPPSSHDTIMKLVRNRPEPLLKSLAENQVENHYDTLPTEEERLTRSYATYEPPSYPQAADIPLLRSISYREAQQSTPPIVQRRSTNSSSNHSQSNTNDDNSHYSEIVGQTRSIGGVINRSYSNNGSIQSSSTHSLRQQKSRIIDEQIEEDQLNENQNDDEQEENSDEDDDHQPLPPIEPIPTGYTAISYLVDAKRAEAIAKMIKRKQARFRWYLAYTIINNYHLFDLRKQAQSRLTILRIHRSNNIDEQQRPSTPTQPVAISVTSESMPVPMMKMAAAPPSLTPSTSRQYLTPNIPIFNEFPQSPAERYIAIRSCMLYDISNEQPNRNRLAVPTDDMYGRPPETSRPTFDRQPSFPPTRRLSNINLSGTPVFQPIPESKDSMADYPLTNASTIASASTLRTQMSLSQHMQAWHQNEMKKIQKKRTTSYSYGPPIRSKIEEKMTTGAIITPQIISSNASQNETSSKRIPSKSPFAVQALEKKTQKVKIDHKKALRTTINQDLTDKSQRRDSDGTDV